MSLISGSAGAGTVTSVTSANGLITVATGTTTPALTLALTTVDATMAGNVTIVSANTFVDGPSASFAAGTWLVIWKALVQVIIATAQGYFFTGKLWDGTTIYDEFESDTPGVAAVSQNGHIFELNGQAVIVLGSSATLKISCAATTGSSSAQILRDVPDNSGSSHTATRLSGVRVA